MIHFTWSQYRAAISAVLALPVIYFISRYNYSFFHSLADGVSIVIAACVFTIIWNSRHHVDNNYYLYTGIALLFFAFLDLMHLLGNKNMGVFAEYGNLGPAFYIASRYVLSISLVIAPLFINRKLNTALMFAVYSLATALILLSILYWRIFPVCIVEGVGLTPFKIISDYIICLILLGAIGLLITNRRSFDFRVLRIIVSSYVLFIATGLTFTLYVDPFGITNMVGHLLQIASFYMIYLAFIETSLTRPQQILFRKLEQNQERLTKNLQQLDQTNAELNQEIITDRKRAEAALMVRTHQLEDANKELEAFSYSVSHDLRAPLRGVDGFSQMLEEDYAEKLDAEGKRILGCIHNDVDRMSKLIDDLLAFSRMGRREMNASGINMNVLAHDVRNELSTAAQGRNIQWIIGELPSIHGDAMMVRQLLFNLLANAVKFTEKKDKAVIELGYRVEGGENIFFVKDNGAGFDMRYVHKLFCVFQRLHTDEEFEGTGVGLAIVQRIVLRHGGRIWAEGEVGCGATFFFTLPEGNSCE